MRAPGIEPVTPPNSTKDLQQSIALNRESTAENTQEITALARKPASLSDEQRAVLAGLSLDAIRGYLPFISKKFLEIPRFAVY